MWYHPAPFSSWSWRAACFAVWVSIAPVSFLVPSRYPLCFSSLFAPSFDKRGGELSCGGRPRLALVARSRCLPSLWRGGVSIGFSSAGGFGSALLAFSFMSAGGVCDAALGMRANGVERTVRSVLFLPFLFALPPRCVFSLAYGPSIIPRPPGRGTRERVIDLRLRAGRRFACFLSYRAAHSACARSLLSRLRFGFSSIGSPRFSDLLGRVSFACVGTRSPFAPCSPSRAFPASSLFPPSPSHPSGSVVSSPLLARPSSPRR